MAVILAQMEVDGMGKPCTIPHAVSQLAATPFSKLRCSKITLVDGTIIAVCAVAEQVSFVRSFDIICRVFVEALFPLRLGEPPASRLNPSASLYTNCAQS